MSAAQFRVLLPNGQYTRRYTMKQIRRAFLAKKISKRSTVYAGGREVPISEFLNENQGPVATSNQKKFAKRLGISFEPGINRMELSKLIENKRARNAEEKDSTDSDSANSEEELAFECMQNELRAEMLKDGSIPLSQATPDDILSYFEHVRDMQMIILYSPNNTFAQLIEGQTAANRNLPAGAILRMCHPDWMSMAILKQLLRLAIWNFPDESADLSKS